MITSQHFAPCLVLQRHHKNKNVKYTLEFQLIQKKKKNVSPSSSSQVLVRLRRPGLRPEISVRPLEGISSASTVPLSCLCHGTHCCCGGGGQEGQGHTAPLVTCQIISYIINQNCYRM